VFRKGIQLVTLLVILVWVTWPIVEMFDTWDKPVHTGNDTQYSIVALGLCAGAAFLFSQPACKAARKVAIQTVTKRIRFVLPSPRFVDLLFLAPHGPGPPASPADCCSLLRI
jgi:hypothetical protein